MAKGGYVRHNNDGVVQCCYVCHRIRQLRFNAL